VAGDLDPEERLLLETYLAGIDSGLLGPPPGKDREGAAAAEIARIVLRAASGQPLDKSALREVLASLPELPPYARGWPATEQQGSPGRVSANERRHQRLAAAGKAAAIGWIGHPAVRREVEMASPTLVAIASPLWMFDHPTVIYVAARLLDTTVILSDGSAWPDAFEGVTESFDEQIRLQRPPYLAALHELAESVAAAGAPLDPNDLGGLLVLAQLVHLDVDWTLEPAELMERLATWPPGWVRIGDADRGHVGTVSTKHGRTARFQRDLAGAAEVIVRRIGPAAIARPYAGGRPRNAGSEPRRDERRTSLRRVIEAFPNVTASTIHRTWSQGTATAGGMLRAELRLEPGDRPPSLSTLRSDLREIG
jgi:hypothetical protein